MISVVEATKRATRQTTGQTTTRQATTEQATTKQATTKQANLLREIFWYDDLECADEALNLTKIFRSIVCRQIFIWP